MADRRVVWITGGGRGIGAEVAKAFAAAGWAVGVSARSKDQIENVAEGIRNAGGEAMALPADVTDLEALKGAHGALVEAYGKVDAVICNAGVAQGMPFHRTTPDFWNWVMGINVTGVYHTISVALPSMVEAGWGRVISIASIAGKVGGKYMAAYCASKHAVVGLTRALSQETATKGVTVNAICPGFVDTPMTDESIRNMVEKTGQTPAQALAYLEGLSPQGRIMECDEIAAMALFLCSDGARGVNGQAINIDGGGTQH